MQKNKKIRLIDSGQRIPDRRTGESDKPPKFFYQNLPGGKKLKNPLLTGEKGKRTLANQKTAVNRPI